MKKCYECGTQVPDDTLVCPKCGAPISKISTNNYAPMRSVQKQPSDVWNNEIFSYLPFIASVLFMFGCLMHLFHEVRLNSLIFGFGLRYFLSDILLLLAAIANFVHKLSVFFT